MAEQNNKRNGGKQKSIRLNIIVSDDDKSRIDRIVDEMGASSITEVTKDAFRLLEFMILKAKEGNKFIMQNKEGRDEVIQIFGVTM